MVVKKGQVMLYGFMLALTIVIFALAIAYPVWESANDARTSSELNCTSTTLSNYDKAACITTDLTPFYFVGILVFIAGTVLVAKIIFS